MINNNILHSPEELAAYHFRTWSYVLRKRYIEKCAEWRLSQTEPRDKEKLKAITEYIKSMESIAKIDGIKLNA